jgi:transglutaminase-like putative cysteine protease
MKFEQIYRLSFDVMLVLASLTLSLEVSDSTADMLYPVLVGFVAVVTFLTVDRNPRLGLSRIAANVLGLVSMGLLFSEYSADESLLLLALGHWLIYLQLIKMFLPKTVEDDWFLFLLGLMQVLIGSVLSQSDYLGVVLFAWALSSLWVLYLFSLHREAIRSRAVPVLTAGPSPSIDDPYPSLIDLPFLFSAFRIAVMTLILGGFIFLAMPRASVIRPTKAGEPVAQHLTGFDETVTLGQLGEILESDNVVMSVEMYDPENNRIAPPPEALWRGVTMDQYESPKGRWRRQINVQATIPDLLTSNNIQPKIVQQIKLEPNDLTVLFALRPVLSAKTTARDTPLFNGLDGTIYRSDARSGSYDYTVVSIADSKSPQPGEYRLRGRLRLLLSLPGPLSERLQAIAQPIVESIPPEDLAARARALEAYLRDSGEFGYTLQMNVFDSSIDPILDFLVNRKEGHCEYFASALALLLRSVGIPSRVVNGFKGGDWNEMGQVLSIRQKHAHSWVEAYVGEKLVDRGVIDGEPKPPVTLPDWITLDPTPGTARNQSVAQVSGFAGNFRQITDFIRYIWVFYIAGFNSERQDRLLYNPIRELIAKAGEGFVMMGQGVRSAAAKLLFFESAGSFVSVRGFFVSFLGLLFLLALVRGVHWLWRFLVRWYRGADIDPDVVPAEVLIYRRLAQLLSKHGLDRPPTETQQEFARRAGVYLTARGTETEPVAEVPVQVVDAFYRIRFGHLSLEPARLKRLEDRLDALEGSLRDSQT